MSAITPDPQQTNGFHSLSRLKRTFSLPLSKIKTRTQIHREANKATVSETSESPSIIIRTEENGNSLHGRAIARNQSIFRSMRGPIGRKGDIRVSRVDAGAVSTDVRLKLNQAVKHCAKNSVPQISVDCPHALEVEAQNEKNRPKSIPKKQKGSRARRWPTQVLARVLEKIHGSGKLEHVAFVIRTVEIERSPSDVLGIYIKQVKCVFRNKFDNSDVTTSSDGPHYRTAIIISRLAPNSIADKQGELRAGDEVLFVNNIDMANLPLKEVAAIMDSCRTLVLIVRSKHIGINNNNVVKLSPTPNGEVPHRLTDNLAHNKPQPTSNDSSAMLSPLRVSNGVPGVKGNRNVKILPPDVPVTSVYDNDFPSDTGDVPHGHKPVQAKGKVEAEYEKAVEILREAINGFEGTAESENKFSQSSYRALTKKQGANPLSEWDLLTEIVSTMNTTSPNGKRFRTTPNFPSISELNLHDEPDYDEVAASELGDLDSVICSSVEVGVDGYAELFPPPSHRSNSSSSSNGGNESGFARVLPEETVGGTISHPMSSTSYAPHVTLTRGLSHPAPGTEDEFKRSYKKSMSLENDSSVWDIVSQNNGGRKQSNSVTVGQRKGWFDKGAKVSTELQKRIEGGSRARGDDQDVSDFSTVHGGGVQSKSNKQHIASNPKDSSYDQNTWFRRNSRRTSSESSMASVPSRTDVHTSNKSTADQDSMPVSPDNVGAEKVSACVGPEQSSGRKTNRNYQEPYSADTKAASSIPESPTDAPSSSNRHIFSKLMSPPRSHKNKLTKKLTKMFGGHDASDLPGLNSTDGNVPPMPPNVLSPVNRLNLELGLAQQRRLSRQFLLDNGRSSHDSSIKPLDLSEFKKYRPCISSQEEKGVQESIEGSLVITLYGARDTKKTMSEVYCVMQVDNNVQHRMRTTMKPCRGSVAWNECYEAKLEEAYELLITLYTWENKHKTLAKTVMPLASLLSKGDQSSPVKLAVKLEPRGTLYVKLSLEDPSTLAGPKVFGADLQSILDDEQSGLPVPLLVHDCIKEVEARGMSVVGIYRLCGSAIAKKELRRRYEEDSKSIILSQENYPDVNVITGILKDFLRELPQPLFPPELLEAITVAMENSSGANAVTPVSSPFEPTPVVEFPQNWTETDARTSQSNHIRSLFEDSDKIHLPPAERATLYALLNHLKKVSSNHAQNKMTCQNLAVCFGPVLLGSISIGSKSMDLTAAIGFKRHIQVLNYMVSNWTEIPVPERRMVKPEWDLDTDDRRTSKRMSKVSLTRRISYINPNSSSSSSVNMAGLGVDSDNRSNSSLRSGLSNIRKSGSLTNILEYNYELSTPAEPIDMDKYLEQENRMFSAEQELGRVNY